MRRSLSALLLCILLAFAFPVQGQEARDLSADAVYSAAGKKANLEKLYDRKYSSYWLAPKGGGGLTIESPEALSGLYICWRNLPVAFSIEIEQNGAWQPLSSHPAADIVHQYYPLPDVNKVRLRPEKDDGKGFAISELFLLSGGATPGWVQRWQPTYEDVDLMLLFAHPDDEVLFFGGTLPYYAAERGMKVLPVCLTKATEVRRHELLNCLWLMGIRHYPVIGPFVDVYAKDLEAAYSRVASRRAANTFVIELIRRHRPAVIVTHDKGGEYGHGAHMLCADTALKCVGYATDPERYPESYALYGGHQVQKLYLHLYKERNRDVQLTMDWDQPLPAFGGKTGFEMAELGYQEHPSQHRYEQYKVEPRDSRRSSYLFGLAFSTVGDDMQKNDFFENVRLPEGT